MRTVLALTAVTMVLEIVVGYASGSMALLADGWHMATHVGALGLASAAYALSRRFADHRAFTFGTGKFHSLAGYTSAFALGLVAIAMIGQAILRLAEPRPIDFSESLPVAVIGLVVNLLSVRLLHSHDHEEHSEPEHTHGVVHPDHNHRAALLHVAADALTSGLAILALLGARFGGWFWLDPAVAMVGGAMIGKWSLDLCAASAADLLDASSPVGLEMELRRALESIDDVRVNDLHVWPLGPGSMACVATIISACPRDVCAYREALDAFRIQHLTIEVRRCFDGHGEADNARHATAGATQATSPSILGSS